MSLNKDLSQQLTIFVEAEQYSEEQKNPETVIEFKGSRNDCNLTV